MRAMVEKIDAHGEIFDLKILSNPNATQGQAPQPIPNSNLQSTEGAKAFVLREISSLSGKNSRTIHTDHPSFTFLVIILF